MLWVVLGERLVINPVDVVGGVLLLRRAWTAVIVSEGHWDRVNIVLTQCL